MTRWFRFYDDALNDPKVQRLPGEKFKVWVNLLCLASRNDGVIPCLDDVTYALRVTRDEMSLLLDEFCDAGLLDPVEVRDAPMSYEPHNWKERQYISDTKDPTAAARSRRYRDRKRDVTYRKRDATVSVTATRADTESDTEPETDKERGGVSTPPGENVVSFRHHVFSGGVIKLEQQAYDTWRRSYSAIEDFDAELQAADDYYTANPPPGGKWFFPVSSWLKKAHQTATERKRRRVPRL